MQNSRICRNKILFPSPEMLRFSFLLLSKTFSFLYHKILFPFCIHFLFIFARNGRKDSAPFSPAVKQIPSLCSSPTTQHLGRFFPQWCWVLFLFEKGRIPRCWGGEVRQFPARGKISRTISSPSIKSHRHGR